MWDHVITFSDEVCWPPSINVSTSRSEWTHRLSIYGREERGQVSAFLAFECIACLNRIALRRLPLLRGQRFLSPCIAALFSDVYINYIGATLTPQNRYLIPLSFIVNLWAYFSTSWIRHVSPHDLTPCRLKSEIWKFARFLAPVVSNSRILALRDS